jgi:signal transduction histidine kinase
MEENPQPASILLVDDRPANLMALEAVLEPLGHRLVKARSGDEALKYLMKEDFALILMDVSMPGLDGFQTVAMIKQRPSTANVPVIFVSAVARELHYIEQGFLYSAIDYVTKPFDPTILRAKVSVLVTLHQQAERILKQRELLLRSQYELRRQRCEREAAEHENQMKDQFLAMVSHELRSPVNQIQGWVAMLRSGKLDVAGAREALETIERNAEIQARLVDDLVDVSHMIHGKMRLDRSAVSLTAIARGAVQAAQPEATRKRVRVTVVAEPDEELITTGDEVRLRQVLGNLLGNAIRHTPPGGSVEVRLDRRGGGAHIEVRDTGDGIAEHDLPFLFDRFWQADRSASRPHHGLGLGLTIVRQVIELHGGAVVAHSDGLGRGASFEIELPLVAPIGKGDGVEAATSPAST